MAKSTLSSVKTVEAMISYLQMISDKKDKGERVKYPNWYDAGPREHLPNWYDDGRFYDDDEVPIKKKTKEK